MATVPFTVRLDESDHYVLTELAKIQNKDRAELSRDLILEGIARHLDPDAIERELEVEKEKRLAAAAELKATAAQMLAAKATS